MSLRKLCMYAMLATLTFVVAKKLNRYLAESESPHTQVRSPLLAASPPAKNEMPPSDFLSAQSSLVPVQSRLLQPLLVQSKNAKNLGLGKVLVASRNVGDPSFANTVILLVRYDEKGVLGLMLNRRTNIPLSRVLERLKAAKERTDPVYVGGPVGAPAVFALFRSPAKIEGAEPVVDGLYLITSKPQFEQTISARPDPGVFHVYLGYAGWTQEQLQKEVELGAWFIFPAETSTVFSAHPDSLWQEMIRKTELQLAQTEPASMAWSHQ